MNQITIWTSVSEYYSTKRPLLKYEICMLLIAPIIILQFKTFKKKKIKITKITIWVKTEPQKKKFKFHLITF